MCEYFLDNNEFFNTRNHLHFFSADITHFYIDIEYPTTANQWPGGITVLIITALIGGIIGSELCLRRLAPNQLRKALALYSQLPVQK